MHALGPNNPNAASTVDRENGQPFSFGDFQLNLHPGAVGGAAMKAGIDPRDPSQWQAADKFAIDYMANNGVGAWKGDPVAARALAGGVQVASNGPTAGFQGLPPPPPGGALGFADAPLPPNMSGLPAAIVSGPPSQAAQDGSVGPQPVGSIGPQPGVARGAPIDLAQLSQPGPNVPPGAPPSALMTRRQSAVRLRPLASAARSPLRARLPRPLAASRRSFRASWERIRTR